MVNYDIHADRQEDNKLDTEFDQILIKLKPLVVNLNDKADRQQSALWVKKLCESLPPGLQQRENRNLYANLLIERLHDTSSMHVMTAPFSQSPSYGPLPILPAHLASLRSDNSQSYVPGWVSSQLTSDLLTCDPLLCDPPMTPELSTATSLTSSVVGTAASSSLFQSPTPRQSKPSLTSSTAARGISPPEECDTFDWTINDDQPHFFDWKKTLTEIDKTKEVPFTLDPLSSIFSLNDAKLDSGYFSPSSHSKESKILSSDPMIAKESFERNKSSEDARCLAIQQRHDANVEQLLKRKNDEQSSLKALQKEELAAKSALVEAAERKVSQIQRDFENYRQSKDIEIKELKHSIDSTLEMQKNESQRLISEVTANHDREKLCTQRRQTTAIRDLLDDTNARLKSMEEQYLSQSKKTAQGVEELEVKCNSLGEEITQLTQERDALELSFAERGDQINCLEADMEKCIEKCTALEKDAINEKAEWDAELCSLKDKHERYVKFITNDHEIACKKLQDQLASSAKETIALTNQLQTQEHASLQHRKSSDKRHCGQLELLENKYKAKVQLLNEELQSLNKTSRTRIEDQSNKLANKEAEIARLTTSLRQQEITSSENLERLKRQSETNSQRVFDDIKRQMAKVESDLNQSKRLREKQNSEFIKQLAEEKNRYQKKLEEVYTSHAEDIKAREAAAVELHNREISLVTTTLTTSRDNDAQDARLQQQNDAERISALEIQASADKCELTHLRRQHTEHVAELSKIREDEMANLHSQFEQRISEMTSNYDQEKKKTEQFHAHEIEKIIKKTGSRLKEIEKDYEQKKIVMTSKINNLEMNCSENVKDNKWQQEQLKQKLSQMTLASEKQQKRAAKKFAASTITLQHALDKAMNRCRLLETDSANQKQAYNDRINEAQRLYEEKSSSLLPADVRSDLEDTIVSLQSQVACLKRKSMILSKSTTNTASAANTPNN